MLLKYNITNTNKMKKYFVKILGVSVLAIAALTFTGCGSDDPDIIFPQVSDVVAKLKNGEMNGTLNESYTLTGSSYSLTGSFIIAEGASLTIPAGTSIIADKNGANVYLAVLKGGKININGTNSNPVVMASKNSNPGDWGGLTICGKATTTAGIDVTAEVGGFKYGGTEDNDSSGSIKNLVIKGTGAQINLDSQYNGLSLYAVGSGTTIENIAVFDGADDGIEFFGGTVSAKNIYLENLEDDAIDWTEGWNGTLENSYIVNTKGGFSTVVEADKDNKNPKLINLTATSIVGGTALQFKKQSGATITNLFLNGYTNQIDMKDGGELSNVIIDGKVANKINDYNKGSKVDISNWNFISGKALSVTPLSGEVSGNVTLTSDKIYNLKGSYIVKDGATLTIEAGTKIIVDSKGTDIYIAVLKGGKININGTANAPVVMASASGNPGDWGGLTICGKATTTAGVNVTAEVGGFKYGGTEDTDTSGTINYLVIKGTGAQINIDSQYNGISLYAVGSGTKIENVSVINGADDGIEFFGGTVSVKNIYLENNEDDSIDWTEGWNGKITNTYILHTISGFSTAIEGDKINNHPVFENLTAISTVNGTALQFKKQSGAVISNLYLDGYTKNIDMKDGASLSNVQIDGADASATANYSTGTKVNISNWSWKQAGL
ncbi:Probable lipoprotein precursor [Tenacibaculum maritimum]|nr:Probable lipoprotein precursor [Tenacibaculum maritimum]CAA0211077.1 Probable lipoprotein precursor [Tenacibaculum maritimum]